MLELPVWRAKQEVTTFLILPLYSTSQKKPFAWKMAWITKLQAGNVLTLPVWLEKRDVTAFWTSSMYLAT